MSKNRQGYVYMPSLGALSVNIVPFLTTDNVYSSLLLLFFVFCFFYIKKKTLNSIVITFTQLHPNHFR